MFKSISVFVFLVCFLGFFWSCSNDSVAEPLSTNEPNTSVTTIANDYKEILVNAEYGWRLDYQPKAHTGAYRVYLKFNENNTITISTDFNNGNDDLNSTYRVDIEQSPLLVIEDYTAFHSIFSVNGFGIEDEFKFEIESATENLVYLRATPNTSEDLSFILYKATAADQSYVQSLQGLDERIQDGYLITNPSLLYRSLVVREVGGLKVFSSDFSFDFTSRMVTINYLDETNQVITEKHPIILTTAGFDFLYSITVAGVELKSFEYNTTTNTFVSANSGHESVISHTIIPGVIYFPEVNTFITKEKYLYLDSTNADFLELTSPAFDALSIASNIDFLRIYFDYAPYGGDSFFEIQMNSGDIVEVYFDYVIELDKTIYFDVIFPDDNYPEYENDLFVMMEILLNPNGFYVERTDESQYISNPSYLLINASDPNYRFSVYENL